MSLVELVSWFDELPPLKRMLTGEAVLNSLRRLALLAPMSTRFHVVPPAVLSAPLAPTCVVPAPTGSKSALTIIARETEQSPMTRTRTVTPTGDTKCRRMICLPHSTRLLHGVEQRQNTTSAAWLSAAKVSAQ